MYVNLKINTAEEYFLVLDREINWDDSEFFKESQVINQILACEMSIFLLRRASGVDGCIIDNMIIVRRNLIDSYKLAYQEYFEFNDFY